MKRASSSSWLAESPSSRGARRGPLKTSLEAGLNFTLITSAGDLDLLGEISGLGQYDQVKAASSPMSLYGRNIDVLDLAGLERAKTAAGRVKDIADLAFIAELKKRQ